MQYSSGSLIALKFITAQQTFAQYFQPAMKFTRSISYLVNIKNQDRSTNSYMSAACTNIYQILILDIDIWEANDAVKINVFK